MHSTLPLTATSWPYIPAATSEASRIKIKAPFDIDLQAWMIQPYNPAISFTEEVEVYKDGIFNNNPDNASGVKAN
jgi:hypothetical protein